ncbi:glutaredoxin family protein [Jeotgalicoccus sp. FSL K6-3177]|uniref:glutaredoxin family protein n=1 Tax=Jeotgalicoccus sp. FSL K6-3177 TaxID=2921494 RepID=UPI0030FD2E3B
MDSKIEFELYTRPTCSDCQDAKAYMEANKIPYTSKDVGQHPELEAEMIKISGNRIVPLFAFYKKGLLGRKKLVNHFIGFENNKEEILSLIESR